MFENLDIALSVKNLNVRYGDFLALENISMEIPARQITSIIGPSGCGKSTFLRCFNRMNDLVATARVEGEVLFYGQNIYDAKVNPVEVRRHVGMVFQKPNPFPKSIYENVAYGPRVNGFKGDMDELVERSLQQAALWDEVKDDLKKSALALSGGQQQRLCIARAIAVEPQIILMDEPASALDPIATLKIEELMQDLKKEYTIVIVTHNMQQAARASDYTAMMMLAKEGARSGTVIEYNKTNTIFTNPRDKRTEGYVTGRFG
jgi:phosphate transport system ATP-binding protein